MLLCVWLVERQNLLESECNSKGRSVGEGGRCRRCRWPSPPPPPPVIATIVAGKPVRDEKVWDGAEGLEWTVPTPAPYHTFEEPPAVPKPAGTI